MTEVGVDQRLVIGYVVSCTDTIKILVFVKLSIKADDRRHK